MNYDYLIPNYFQNPFGFGISVIIWVTFGYFLKLWFGAKGNINIANNLLSIITTHHIDEYLESVVSQGRKSARKHRNTLESEFSNHLEKVLNEQKEGNSVLVAFKQKRMPVGLAAISDHLKNIFLSGVFESRLEVEALIRHTELRLFQEAIRLKNILATFIVLGLLGTLFGLSESLQNFDDKSSEITKLVSAHLPSAFVPSIWGIICTIVGMFLYNWLVHQHFVPLKTALENFTLNVWVPKLCPVFTERLVEKLEENARRVEDQFANAAKVAEFAREINDETRTFKQNLVKANETLGRIKPAIEESELVGKTLKQFADKMHKFSEKFMSGMDTFKSYEERLASHYGELTVANQGLASLLVDWSRKFESIIERYNSQAVEINRKVEDIIASIMDFEEHFLVANTQQTVAVTGLVTTLRTERESEVSINREIAEKILLESTVNFANIIKEMGQLTTSLNGNLHSIESALSGVDSTLNNNLSVVSMGVERGLAGIQSEMTGGLNAIPQRLEEHHSRILTQFARYDAPVKSAAEKIDASYAGMVTAVQEFIKQSSKQIVENTTKIEENITAKLSELTGELTKKDELVATQVEINQKLILAINSLNESLTTAQAPKRTFKFFS